ncbi:MAG: hypothetical protein R2706_12475 [Acidimicrobiales bacterium]
MSSRGLVNNGRRRTDVAAGKASASIESAQLLSDQAVTSQGQLVELLAELDIVATQATVSRDLEDLGAIKVRVPGGQTVYAIPEQPTDQLAPEDHMRRVLGEWLVEVERSGDIVVLRTPRGPPTLWRLRSIGPGRPARHRGWRRHPLCPGYRGWWTIARRVVLRSLGSRESRQTRMSEPLPKRVVIGLTVNLLNILIVFFYLPPENAGLPQLVSDKSILLVLNAIGAGRGGRPHYRCGNRPSSRHHLRPLTAPPGRAHPPHAVGCATDGGLLGTAVCTAPSKTSQAGTSCGSSACKPCSTLRSQRMGPPALPSWPTLGAPPSDLTSRPGPPLPGRSAS